MSEDAKEPFSHLITIYTIGFTHKSAEEFFTKLKMSGVKRVVDVRPFASSQDFPRVHWLQVNSIHLEDNPVWRLE